MEERALKRSWEQWTDSWASCGGGLWPWDVEEHRADLMQLHNLGNSSHVSRNQLNFLRPVKSSFHSLKHSPVNACGPDRSPNIDENIMSRKQPPTSSPPYLFTSSQLFPTGYSSKYHWDPCKINCFFDLIQTYSRQSYNFITIRHAPLAHQEYSRQKLFAYLLGSFSLAILAGVSHVLTKSFFCH